MTTRLRVVGKLAACAAAACAAFGGGAAWATEEHPVIAFTERGLVKGVATPTVKRFLGIPYAEPPVGALRWQPPQRVEERVWLRDATQFANHCPQNTSFFGLASVTEDCLYLNVYAPNHRGWADLFEKHPVMVWIHGGSLTVGESDGYDPARLVEREDVVVVTINYRLGALGFMAHPALSAEASYAGSGNYGWMDQQVALQWVQRNIRFFGGDSGNVTIFGESAGATSVHAQLASPGSAGLFHRAIIQSAGYVLATLSLSAAEARGTAIATAVGCPEQTAACLRSVPVEILLAKQGGAFNGAVDGKFLTQPIRDALAKGEFAKVPMIQGTNRDEYRWFTAMRELVYGPLTAAQYQGAMVAYFGVSPAVAAYLATYVYPLAAYPSPSIAFSAAGTDGGFACAGRASVRLLAKHVPTYAYEFNDPEPPQPYLPPVSFPYGAYHTSEIQYVLGVRPNEGIEPAPFTADQVRLSNVMVSYWARFARNGDPNSPFAPVWAPYDPATDVVQSLVPPEPAPKAGFAADHKCAIVMPGT